MKLWIDAQLSPALAVWITENFSNIEATAIRELGLRDAERLGYLSSLHNLPMRLL